MTDIPLLRYVQRLAASILPFSTFHFLLCSFHSTLSAYCSSCIRCCQISRTAVRIRRLHSSHKVVDVSNQIKSNQQLWGHTSTYKQQGGQIGVFGEHFCDIGLRRADCTALWRPSISANNSIHRGLLLLRTGLRFCHSSRYQCGLCNISFVSRVRRADVSSTLICSISFWVSTDVVSEFWRLLLPSLLTESDDTSQLPFL